MSDFDISNAISQLRLGIEPSPLPFLQETPVNSTNATVTGVQQTGTKKQRRRRGGKDRRKLTKYLADTMATVEGRSLGLEVLPLTVQLLPVAVIDVKNKNSHTDQGIGEGPENGTGKCPVNVVGEGPGNSSAQGPGNYSARGPGNSVGERPGNSSAQGPGNYSARGPGNSVGKGPGNKSAKGPGNYSETGPGNAIGKGPGNGPLKYSEKGPGGLKWTKNENPKKVVQKTVAKYRCTKEECKKSWSSIHGWKSGINAICGLCNSKAKTVDEKDEECELDSYSCEGCGSFWQSLHDPDTLEQFCDSCEVMVRKENNTQRRVGRHSWYHCLNRNDCGAEWDNFYDGKIYSQRCSKCYSRGELLKIKKIVESVEENEQRKSRTVSNLDQEEEEEYMMWLVVTCVKPFNSNVKPNHVEDTGWSFST